VKNLGVKFTFDLYCCLIPKKKFIPPAFGLADCCRAGIIQIRSFSARPDTLGEGNLTIDYGTTALESRRVGVHALRAYTKAGPSGVGFLLNRPVV